MRLGDWRGARRRECRPRHDRWSWGYQPHDGVPSRSCRRGPVEKLQSIAIDRSSGTTGTDSGTQHTPGDSLSVYQSSPSSSAIFSGRRGPVTGTWKDTIRPRRRLFDRSSRSHACCRYRRPRFRQLWSGRPARPSDGRLADAVSLVGEIRQSAHGYKRVGYVNVRRRA
jgi:hypothetical protein